MNMTEEDWEGIICPSFRFYFWMIQWSSWLSFTVSGPKTVLLIAKSAAWLYHSDHDQETKNKTHIIWNVCFLGFFISFKFWYFPAHMNLGTSLFIAVAQTDLNNWQNSIFTVLLETTLLKTEAWIFEMWLSWAQFCTSCRLTTQTWAQPRFSLEWPQTSEEFHLPRCWCSVSSLNPL